MVGVLPRIWRDPLRFFEDVARRHGPVARVGLGKFTLYLLSSPEAVRYVLQENAANYWKGAGVEMIKPVMGEGIATSEGAAWLRQRRLLQPFFSRRRLADLVPAMRSAVEEMLLRWERKEGEVVDVAAELSGLLQTLIFRSIFGSDLAPERTAALGEALVEVNRYVNSLVWSLLPEWLPSPRRRRFRAAMALLEEAVVGVIEARRRDPRPEAPDLLARLLEARDDEGQGLSDRLVRDEVMTLYFAGHDTTSTAVAWTLWLLAEHPEWAERVAAEALACGEVVGADDLPRLEATDRVFRETLRLYPPGWLTVRTPYADDEILGFHVPKNAPLLISQWVIHRDPTLWEDPTRFDPDRFLPERSKGRPRFAYFPFGGGQRLCIGNVFAENVVKLVAAGALRRFRFEPLPGAAPVPQPLTTLRAKHGVRLRLRRR